MSLQKNLLRITGYSNRFSVRPNEAITFHVHCENNESYEAEIVRLIHGDTNPAGPGYKEELVETDILKHVMTMLDEMDSREATVVRMRFGLDTMEPHTLKEIGEELGLTRERVRQIETEALNKLGEGLRDPHEALDSL